MTELGRSKKIIDILEEASQKICPDCGETSIENRIIGGVMNGRKEAFDERIICPICGADLVAAGDKEKAPLKRSEREAIQLMRCNT